MRSIPQTTPRRRPRQARAQATVDAIVTATAKILVEEGYDRASTNRIAVAAGVSIGSLYQYFPSKEALVSALVDQHLAQMDACLTELIATSAASTLQENTRMVVGALIAAYRVNPRLHEVLCQEVPKVGELKRVYELEEKLSDAGRRYLLGHKINIRPENLERAMFLLGHAVPPVIRAAVKADPLASEDHELAAELTELVLRYLMIEQPDD